MHAPTEESTHTLQYQLNMVFTNCSEEDTINHLTVKEIAQAQEDDAVLKNLSKTDKYRPPNGRGYSSPMQGWQDGRLQSSSV